MPMMLWADGALGLWRAGLKMCWPDDALAYNAIRQSLHHHQPISVVTL